MFLFISSSAMANRHGTGHGVGHSLNVHEGPHGLGNAICKPCSTSPLDVDSINLPACNEVPLIPGMTLSNEPGYYADGKFGIRIESIVLVKESQTLE